MTSVVIHTPDVSTPGTIMRRAGRGDDVVLLQEQATPELDDLVARGMARYVENVDPWAFDEVLRGGDLHRDVGGDVQRESGEPSRAGHGRVVLLGGGPGDPALLTVAGLEAIRRADVIVCDRLAPLGVLDHARTDAEIIHVGKIPRGAFTPQEHINEILVEHARAGRFVVRFKGGDTFVFGRGGEEWEACVEAGVPVDVIPGVSSALAVPALAGIPVTHRTLTQGFTVVSGHVPPGDARSTVDWAALAKSHTTLVVLMGVATLPAIADALMTAGLDAATPAATIENGATPQQRVVRGPLSTIAEIVRSNGIAAPAITVIGDVVEALPHGDDGGCA